MNAVAFGREDSALRIVRDVAIVTGAVTLASTLMRGSLERYVATTVCFVFLGATWLMVWRHDDETVRRRGLALGGLVLPAKSEARGAVASWQAGLRALGWAALCGAILFVPFYFGFRFWHHVSRPYHLPHLDLGFLNEAAGQLLIVALPEEAFYRGAIQSRFDDVWPPRFRILGADLGPSLLVTSALFALGHIATIHEPQRLAVFFPSLVFGYLRARTGGIGAGCVFHAMCNLLSELVARGFAG